MALPTDPVGPVIELGLDDFSFRRGRTFGTILVNLQTHQVLDVLPDRTADTSAAWMAAHLEIEVVSRDRGGDYAAAARKAVPGARQTADRFHLLKNLGEALQGVLARHLAAHRKRQTETARASPLQTSPMGEPPKVIPKSVARSTGKTGAAAGSLPARGCPPRARVLANLHRWTGRGQSRYRFTLVEPWHVSRTKATPSIRQR